MVPIRSRSTACRFHPLVHQVVLAGQESGGLDAGLPRQPVAELGPVWDGREGAGIAGGAIAVTVGDLDRDGDPDLAAVSLAGDELAWFENTSGDASAWSANQPIASLDGPRDLSVHDLDFDGGGSAVAADVDRDGDSDVVGSDAGDLSWFERLPDGWALHEVDCCATDSVAVGDLDGDGDPDIAGSVGTRVRWWENGGSPLDDMGGGLGTSWTRHTLSEGHTGLIVGVAIADRTATATRT